MKRILLAIATVLTGTLIMASCNNSNQKQVKEQNDAPEQKLNVVGGDRDEHGCIGSAGYQWSELLKDCIRPFEKGIRMKAAKNDKGQAAYLVFNSDSTQVELFLPKVKNHPILSKKKDMDDSILWSGPEEGSLTVRCIENIWGIYLHEDLQYVNL